MFSLLTSAHAKTGDKDPVLQWLKNQTGEGEMCHYCYVIIDFMLSLLIFVRSVREGGFSLYVSSFTLTASRSAYMICLTYQLHHTTCTNDFQMAILFFKSQTKSFD